MEQTIQPTKDNEKIMADYIAQQIKQELQLRKNFALNLVEDCEK